MAAPVTPETARRTRWLKHAREPHIRAGVTEARGPFGPRHRWSLWIVGRWPVLIPRFPGGAAPREPPFAGVSAGSGPPTRGPYAAARQRPRGRSGGITCVRTGSEGLQWGQLDGRMSSSRYAGGAAAAGRSFAPSGFILRTFCPFGGFGPDGRHLRFGGGCHRRCPAGTRYLVDSASSHMLVSKIKPCMSKYKQSIR
jgi:hypothetical protein